MPNTRRANRESPDRTAVPALRPVLSCALFALFILIAVASFLPGRRLWGINHLAFYPLPVRILALLLMALSFMPAIARAIHSFLSGALERIRASRKRIVLFSIIAALVAMALFIGYRSSTLLLGDGHLVVRNYEYASEGYTNVVTRDIPTIIRKEHIAKGASILYYISVKVSEGIFNGTPVNGIRIFNCILGGVFVFILLSIVLRGELSAEIRIWSIFLVLSSGMMELFFGYVENYTPLVFFSFLYLISCFILIHRRRSFWILISFLCLLFSVFTHVQAVLLVPSFVLLLVWGTAGKRGTKMLRYLTPSLVVLTAAGAFAARAFTAYGEHILPLRSTDEIHGIIAASHWIDILNELLLLLPPLFVFIVMAAAIGRMKRVNRQPERTASRKKARRSQPARKTTGTTRIEKEGGEWLTLDAEWHFALLVSVPTLLYLALFKAEIGMPRDWDLFTIASLGLLPCALLVLNRFLGLLRTRSIPLVTVPALVMSVMMGIAWIGVNADASRSAERFERMLEYDRTNEAYLYEILAKHYDREQQPGAAIPVLEKAVSVSHNPRQYVILGRLYMEDGRREDAIEVMYRILREGPDFDHAEWARSNLVTLLDETNRYDELLNVARDGTRDHPEQPIYHYFYGKMLLATGRFREGVDELLECRRLNPPPQILKQIDDVIGRLQTEGKI